MSEKPKPIRVRLWKDENLNEQIVGARVLEVSESSDAVELRTDRGVFRVEAEAECCNSVWFEHFGDRDALLGQVITGLEGHDWYETEKRDIAEGIEAMDVTLTTRKGRYTLEMRNDWSGGMHYGGSVAFYRHARVVEETREGTRVIC